MKLKYHSSACVEVSGNDTRILVDPWLVDGEYYGSWNIYPPYFFHKEDFQDVNAIYISHIHPDHFSPKTLKELNHDIPIYILDYKHKFLKNNLEKLGWKVIEVPHGNTEAINKGLFLTVYASDNCNPLACGNFFGCGASAIDSLSVISDGEHTIVNTNDSPFPLAQKACERIKKEWPNVDMLLTGYSGAGPYPQCFNLSDENMKIAVAFKRKHFINQARDYIKLFQPKHFMPFAGRYELGGKLWQLNKNRGMPTLIEAYLELDEHFNAIILNRKGVFDIDTELYDQPYNKEDVELKDEYVRSILSHKKLDYESEYMPSKADIETLIPDSFVRFKKMCDELGYESKVLIIIKIPNGYVVINSGTFDIVDSIDVIEDHYILLDLDPRLLFKILKGEAHWNNAEIGSHIRYTRKPNTFDRAFFYCMSFFHI